MILFLFIAALVMAGYAGWLSHKMGLTPNETSTLFCLSYFSGIFACYAAMALQK